jgi:uncharacterized protein YbaR (Trm112 family)
MTIKSIKKPTKKARPATLVRERAKKQPRLGCPTFNCKGTCRYVYVGDDAALQCPTCGMFYRMMDGIRPWFFIDNPK